jgi:hypothetical protein
MRRRSYDEKNKLTGKYGRGGEEEDHDDDDDDDDDHDLNVF